MQRSAVKRPPLSHPSRNTGRLRALNFKLWGCSVISSMSQPVSIPDKEGQGQIVQGMPQHKGLQFALLDSWQTIHQSPKA